MYKMLIVDDDYIAREGLRDLIDWAASGIDVAGEAEDGAEALRKVKQLKPDIILTDVVMPVMTGIEMAEKLREEYPGIKVIMVSAHQDIRYVKASMKLEAVDYILKPFNLEELKQVIDRVTGKLEKEQDERRLEEDVNRHFTDSIASAGLPVLYELQERILAVVGTDQPEQLEQEVKSYFNTLRSHRMDSLLFLTSRCSELIVKAASRSRQYKDEQAAGALRNSLQHFRYMNNSYQIEQFVLKTLAELDAGMNEARSGSTRKAIREVESIIRESFDRNLTIPQLANEVFLSPGHLQALFKKETGQTINDYITLVRIEHAKTLLRNPANKIYEVANRVGYQDTHYFTRIFKKLTGMNPLDYREGHR
ncbi:MAG: two component transcriptional regulator, AraC family [Paenibacillaceae bacterium]|jgi:two-component system response regulator YesN|nr:two component transcriptional regulator, AraC family [Paenibacillaceae bacterium]